MIKIEMVSNGYVVKVYRRYVETLVYTEPEKVMEQVAKLLMPPK